MGIVGAGIATTIARVLMAGAMYAYVWYNGKMRLYREHWAMIPLRWPIFKNILNLGVPVGMQMVFEVGAFSAAAIMVGWLGVKQLAAHQVALSMAATTYMMATGISAAATVRVSNFLGSGDRHQLQVAGYSSMLMVIAFMGSTATIFVLCKSFLPYLFIHDEEVVGIASSLLIIAAFFQVSDGVQAVGLGCLRGLSDVKIPTMITLLAYWVIGLPVGYLIGNRLGWGVYGIWTGLSIGLTTAAIMLFFRFRYLSRQGKILELQQRAK